MSKIVVATPMVNDLLYKNQLAISNRNNKKVNKNTEEHVSFSSVFLNLLNQTDYKFN